MKKFYIMFLAAVVGMTGFTACSKGAADTEDEYASEASEQDSNAQKEKLKEAYSTKSTDKEPEVVAAEVAEAEQEAAVEQAAVEQAIVEQAVEEIVQEAAAEAAVEVAVEHITEGQGESGSGSAHSEGSSKSAVHALAKLLSGNSMYLTENITPDISDLTRQALVDNGQHPYAIVITCSDSRVPAELIFDAGLGEIFVIRTAGNVVSDFEIGSVEYGAEHLGTPLVFVLGHTNCGAVTAATEGGEAGGKIQAIVNEIAPSVQKAREQGGEENLLPRAIAFNVENSINRIMSSEIMQELVEEGKVAVIGGVYDINSGGITILE